MGWEWTVRLPGQWPHNCCSHGGGGWRKWGKTFKKCYGESTNFKMLIFTCKIVFTFSVDQIFTSSSLLFSCPRHVVLHVMLCYYYLFAYSLSLCFIQSVSLRSKVTEDAAKLHRSGSPCMFFYNMTQIKQHLWAKDFLSTFSSTWHWEVG